MPRPAPIRAAARLLVLGALGALACATAEPTGPFFRPAPAPTAGQALLYLYRGDEDPARGDLQLRLDGTHLDTLRDGEFAALFIAPGRHQLDVSLRALPLLATTWTSTQFCVDETGTAYIRLWTQLVAEETPESRQRDVAAPGWPDQRASLAILAASESASSALPRLETQREAPWSPRELSPSDASTAEPFESRCRGEGAP